MNHTKIVTLVLAVLVLVALGHHQLVRVSTNRLNTNLVPAADAAELSNDQGARCVGTGTWHFVNNQVGAVLPPGTLTATFSCGTEQVTAFKVNPNGNQQFVVETSGDCALEDASTDLPGRLVLSDFVCAAATPTPTPTPAPTP